MEIKNIKPCSHVGWVKPNKNLCKIEPRSKFGIPAQHYYNVDGVTILEPNDKRILAKLRNKFNIYHKLVLTMKQATQTYCNIRLIMRKPIN